MHSEKLLGIRPCKSLTVCNGIFNRCFRKGMKKSELLVKFRGVFRWGDLERSFKTFDFIVKFMKPCLCLFDRNMWKYMVKRTLKQKSTAERWLYKSRGHEINLRFKILKTDHSHIFMLYSGFTINTSVVEVTMKLWESFFTTVSNVYVSDCVGNFWPLLNFSNKVYVR